MSILSSFGVFWASSSDSSLSLSWPFVRLSSSRLLEAEKFSLVRLRRSPPFAETSSRISFGGGSLPWKLLIS